MSFTERDSIVFATPGTTTETEYPSIYIEKFNRLVESLKGHDGEFVLAIRRLWERGWGGYLCKEEVYLGIIKEPYAIIKPAIAGGLVVVSDKYVHTGKPGFLPNLPESSVMTWPGEVPIMGVNLLTLDDHLGPSPDPEHNLIDKNTKKAEIIVGDEAVLNWVVAKCVGFYTDVAERAKSDPKVNKWFKENYFRWGYLEFFNNMQRKLGRVVPFPDGLQYEYEVKNGIRQAEVFKNLRALATQGDDKLKNNVEFRELIKEAFALRMNKIQGPIKETIGPGEERHIYIGKYITYLAEHWGIEIPKE